MQLDTLDRLRQTPAWKAIEAEDESAREAERAQAVEAARAATEARDRVLPRIEAKLPGSLEAVTKDQEALRRSQAAHQKLVQQRQAAIAECSAATRKEEMTLRATAPKEIAETRASLERTRQAARSNFQMVDRLPTPEFTINPKAVHTQSNTATVTALMTAAIEGIRQCDALVTAPLTRAEIRAKLEQILASVPRLESTGFQFEIDLDSRQPLFEKVERR
jgi:hypothetical protein